VKSEPLEPISKSHASGELRANYEGLASRLLAGLVVFAQGSRDVLVANRRTCLRPVRTGLRFWRRLELGVDDRVEAATLSVTERDPPVLADSSEDFERCLVGRVHFLREQLFTAVGEIQPQRYEHKHESRQTRFQLPLPILSDEGDAVNGATRADGILYLADETFGRFDQRWLRILKLRGADYLMGKHSFRIGGSGIEVFPRFESIAPPREMWSGERVPLGVEGIDANIGGGLPRGSATLVAGPSGAGKSVLGLHFVADGIARGEHCLYLSFQQSDEQLIAHGETFGWPFKAAVESGLLRIRHLEPVEISLDAVGAELRQASLGESRVHRVVVDSLAELEPAARGTARFPDYLTALTGLFASIGATTLLTSETTAFFGPAFELPHGLAFVADNVILLRYAELESEVRRVLAVVKLRDGDHTKNLLEVEITKNGMTVTGKFSGLTGVLGGNPMATPPSDAQPPATS
jgi:KaiC/GvpD/RAD55 family RecA-like ATPase